MPLPDWRRPYSDDEPGLTAADYAALRNPDRTYITKSFELKLPQSQDFGQPARRVRKVFEEHDDCFDGSPETQAETTRSIVTSTPAGRKQVELMVVREAGLVRELQIQRITVGVNGNTLEPLLRLDREGATKLIDLLAVLVPSLQPGGGAESIRVDDALLQDVLRDPDAVKSLYQRDPDAFRRLIENDLGADDVIATAHRRSAVDHFRELLEDPTAFAVAQETVRGPEAVWQAFFEDNSWILGVGLAGQLFTSWNEESLEQVVTGFSVAGRGKRTDALLRTNGRIRSMVFAEIKHHRTPLLAPEPYRPGCWSPSSELVGGVTQIQQTVYRAVQGIGERLADLDDEGAETGSDTFLVRPRCFLVVGNQKELMGTGGGVIPDRHRSFELYRRNLYEPEVITFDELLARAEWHVQQVDRAGAGGG